MLWYTREASVAVWVANLPMIWPLMREWIPFLRSVTGSKPSYNYGGRGTNGYGKSDPRSKNKSASAGTQLANGLHGGPDVQLSDLKMGTRTTVTHGASSSTSSDDLGGRHGGFDFDVKKFGRRDRSPDSDERVLNTGQAWGKGLGDIRQETTIEVEHESVDLEKGFPSRRASRGQIEWKEPGVMGREVRIEGAGERSF